MGTLLTRTDSFFFFFFLFVFVYMSVTNQNTNRLKKRLFFDLHLLVQLYIFQFCCGSLLKSILQISTKAPILMNMSEILKIGNTTKFNLI